MTGTLQHIEKTVQECDPAMLTGQAARMKNSSNTALAHKIRCTYARSNLVCTRNKNVKDKWPQQDFSDYKMIQQDGTAERIILSQKTISLNNKAFEMDNSKK